jgi:hypothetical protein
MIFDFKGACFFKDAAYLVPGVPTIKRIDLISKKCYVDGTDANDSTEKITDTSNIFRVGPPI